MTGPAPETFESLFRDPIPSPPRRGDSGSRAARGHVPGEIGIWVFIFGDLVIFGVFFCVFLVERSRHLAVFTGSRHGLHIPFGAVNTLLLLTSSLLVAQAVHSYRRGSRLTQWLLGGAMTCGAAFVASKAIEYTVEVHAGHNPGTNSFYMYYFMFTGIHLLHLMVGMLALTLIWRISRKPVRGVTDLRYVEVGASYWHLVDILWIVLFPLLYLIR